MYDRLEQYELRFNPITLLHTSGGWEELGISSSVLLFALNHRIERHTYLLRKYFLPGNASPFQPLHCIDKHGLARGPIRVIVVEPGRVCISTRSEILRILLLNDTIAESSRNPPC